MNLKEKEYREEIGARADQMEKIIENAEKEHRDLTSEEKQTFNRLEQEVGDLQIKLKKETSNESVMNARELLKNNGTQKTPTNPAVWETKEGKELRVFKPSESISTQKPEVGLGQIARAMLTGARNEAEKRALSEGTDSAGGFTVPSLTMTDFFDKLRSKSRIVQAGARTINLESDETTIARVSGDPTAIWHEENTQESDSDVTFEGAVFKPRTLMILVKASREMVADSVNINSVLEDVFSGTVGAAVDNGILFGSNASGEMKGLTSYSLAEVDMGTNGAELTNYDPLVQAYRKMLDNNSVAPSAYLMAPREWETLSLLKDSTGRYLDRPQALDGIPFLDTTHIPTDETHGTANDASRIVTGNWNDLVIGLRSEMRIELLREKYADSYQYGFLVHMRVDALPAREESFAQITGIIPESAT